MQRYCVAPVASRVQRCSASTRLKVPTVMMLVLSIAHFTHPASVVWKATGGTGGSEFGNTSAVLDDYGYNDEVKKMKKLIEKAAQQNKIAVNEARMLFKPPGENDDAPPKIRPNKTHPPMYIRAINNHNKMDTKREDLLEHRQWRKEESEALDAFPSYSIYKAKQRRMKRFKASIVHHGDQDKRLRLCPENAHDATHAECVCRPGHTCVGIKCYVTNRGTAFRIIGKHACEDCRCDPTPCETHRAQCTKECQSMAITHLKPRLPSGRSQFQTMGLPRVMCIMFVLEDDRYEATKMRKTWAKACDEFLLMDRNEDSEPPEAYANTKGFATPKWNSTVAMWRHVQKHYIDRADWFLFVNDRTYVRMMQLKQFIAAESQAQPSTSLFLGRRMRHQSGLIINAWNAGSVLNRMAVTDLLKSIDGIGLTDVQKFRPLDIVRDVEAHDTDDDADVVEAVSSTIRQQWEYTAAAIPVPPELVCNSNPSIDGGGGITSTLTRMSACFAVRGIRPSDTQDAHGKERFHLTNPTSVLELPAWDQFHEGALKSRTAPFPFPAGIEGVSKESITFSQSKGYLAEAFHSFLRKMCYSTEAHLRYFDGWNDTKFEFEDGGPLNQKGLKKIFP